MDRSSRLPAMASQAACLASIVACLNPGPLSAQVSAGPWVDRVISSSVDFANAAVPADVDGDGDIDTLAVGRLDGLGWQENALGDGSLWTNHPVILLSGGWSVVAADFDGDGDIDALTGATGIDAVAWHCNAIGDGSVWITQTVSVSAISARMVNAADVDGDGDIDGLSAAEDTGQIHWYGNRFGDGSVWTENLIGANSISLSVTTADLDGDGDLDVVSASSGDDTVAWFENLEGSGTTWDMQVISALVDGAHSVAAADIDGEGNLDVLAASFQDSTIAWHENRMSSGKPWAERRISLLGGFFTSVAAVDMDVDGDPDVVSSGFDSATEPPFVAALTWYYENSLNEEQGWTETPLFLASGKARTIAIVDFDGDCDPDVLYSESNNDRIAWVENQVRTSDCNSNGIADRCEILAGALPDCNGNLFPDACDISRGISADVFGLLLNPPAKPQLQKGGNGIPDECEAPFYSLPLPSTLATPGYLEADASAGQFTATGAYQLGLDAGPAHRGAPFVLLLATVGSSFPAVGSAPRLDSVRVAVHVAEFGTLDNAGRSPFHLALVPTSEPSLPGRQLACLYAVLDAHGHFTLLSAAVPYEALR